MNKRKKMEKNSGSALLLSTVLLFVVLAMVASLSYVTVMEQKMSGKTKSSIGAFYNSESGVEWALNKIASLSGSDLISEIGTPNGKSVQCPSSDCSVYFLDEKGEVLDPATANISAIKAVRSVGKGNETQRAIEAAVAAGDETRYQSLMFYPATNWMVCRLDTWTGETECKYKSNADASWSILGGSDAWSGGTSAGKPNFEIDISLGSDWELCRTNIFDGSVECKHATFGGSWDSATDPW